MQKFIIIYETYKEMQTSKRNSSVYMRPNNTDTAGLEPASSLLIGNTLTNSAMDQMVKALPIRDEDAGSRPAGSEFLGHNF